MKLKPYKSYKDSNIKWIGETPEHWDVTFLKRFVYSISSGKTKNIDENGKYSLYGSTGIIGSTNNLDYNGVFVLIARVGANAGKTHIAKGKMGITDNTLIVKYTPMINYKFLFYLLSNYDFKTLTIGSGQPLITGNDVKNIKVSIPNLNEQKQIVNYLDKETSKIDETIAKNEELIQLLEEKRIALINQVVTKGLNSDVPMKDSGIEWIGEIPEHWEITPLKRFVKLHNGKEINVEVEKDEDNAIGVYGSGGLFKYTNEYLFNGESVLFGRKGTLGKPIYLNDIFWTVDTMYYLSFTQNMIPKYCYYTLILFPWNKISTETAKPSVVGGDVTNSMFAIPSIEEQKQITEYLDNEINKIDKTKSKIQENINLLEEYKTSLIHHVVTGKVDVRGEEI